MVGSVTKVCFIVLVTLAIVVPCLEAGIAEFDDYLKAQAEKARKLTLETYVPNPEEITEDLNLHVHKALEEYENELTNSTTRRELRQGKRHRGPCQATNPIDRCWRCQANWANDRYRLAKCGRGFGRRATGGLGGPIYVVTDPSDRDMQNPVPGTLRYAVTRQGPLWITFKTSMVITLQEELMLSSDKTIDGRGANVQIKGGGGITLQFVNNVIVHNLRISKIVPREGGMVMLLGASDSFSGDKIMQVTVAFNHFGQGLIQRMPRLRWGFVHVVNNDYTHWLMYAIGGSSGPTVLSQGNRFIAPNNDAAKEITHRDYASPDVWKKWQWTSDQDYFMNGATFTQTGTKVTNLPYGKKFIMKPRHGMYANRLTRWAGALPCVVGKPC
ncbi:unnamed protein product [Lupinus luteus]|uniref:Pectate lyase n=1 Tax=Lupinus luteus TaxID=3873 RepID=A0AAV1XJN3_LUPLU